MGECCWANSERPLRAMVGGGWKPPEQAREDWWTAGESNP